MRGPSHEEDGTAVSGRDVVGTVVVTSGVELVATGTAGVVDDTFRAVLATATVVGASDAVDARVALVEVAGLLDRV
jgi:hypothetical protein